MPNQILSTELPHNSREAISQFVQDLLPDIDTDKLSIQELQGSDFLKDFPGLHVFAVSIEDAPYIILGVTADKGSRMRTSQMANNIVSAQIEAIGLLESNNPGSERFIINVSDLREMSVGNFSTGTISTVQSMFRRQSVLKHIVLGQGIPFKIAYQVFENFIQVERVSVYDKVEKAVADLRSGLGGEV